MNAVTSKDAFEVYRGVESKIKDEYQTPIVNGRVYFAYDSDKLFYDAQGVRHEISGGGGVSFIKANAEPNEEGETGYWIFQRSDIEGKKLEEDNIILASNNAIYRVVLIDEDEGVVKTSQIAGGGGGGGSTTSPITIVTITPFPERIIDTQDVTCVIKINSRITTDETCLLQVKINGQELVKQGSVNAPLRTERTITIPHEYFSVTELNVVTIRAVCDANEYTKPLYFYAFHSEFSINGFNPRRPYGTDATSPEVQQLLTFNCSFTGLDNIKGHIRMLVDEEGELINLADESSPNIQQMGGGAITGTGTILNIPCTLDEFSGIEHGSHIITLKAYAVVDDREYFVDEVAYDIIWATEEGGITPIIVSNYTNTEEENYNIINIQYVVYAKNQENVTVHQYVNDDELPTSPIIVSYDRSYNTWKTWSISKYIPQTDNTFRLTAFAEDKKADKEWSVYIRRSDLILDPVNDNLLLYLSALDRSNDELASSRKKWEYTNYNNQTYAAQFNNFTWNNDGWQYDDDGDNVLRLNNGASVFIPFTGILQNDEAGSGFTIETEFRCRNAISFAKLMTYTARAVQDTDEFGNPLWEMEPLLDENDQPITRIALNENGEQIQEVDGSNHLAFSYVEPSSGDTITLYLHEAGDGSKVYYTSSGLYKDTNGDPIIIDDHDVEPIWVYETVMTYKLDDQGRKIPIEVEGGAIEKNINYNQDGTVANAVGSFFSSGVGFCIGTQEAFFSSTGKKVNVRYADNDKVKVSIVVDPKMNLLYIYINSVLSGVESYGDGDNFKASGVTGISFNSNYCDLDLYTIRIYDAPLNFDGIVQNWIGDAPNLEEKRQRYLENHITTVVNPGTTREYVTLDYELTKELSRKMAENYKKQVALKNYDAQKGLPIMVISTYPTILSNDTKSDLLPYNKAIKQYVDMRFWDPNYDTDKLKNFGIPGFKVQDFELSVQGTSSQGYPRRNYKAKIKATKSDVNAYAGEYPFYFTTWDGNDDKKDIWPASDSEEDWALFTSQTGGYTQLEAIDIGNGTEETKFCFKADYMDSSSAHNTSLANYVDALCVRDSNNTYNLIHPMKRLEGNAGKKYRTTVYGFPMLIFWDHKGSNSSPEFVGRYNFNTDKSATDSFGFTLKVPQEKTVDSADKFYRVVCYKGTLNSLEALTELAEAETKPKIADGYVIDNNVYAWDGRQFQHCAGGFTIASGQKTGKDLKDSIGNLVGVQAWADVAQLEEKPPTYKEVCECWELTSNQHGFTGFRRNDWETQDANNKLDFYNFFECRYHVMDFDPDDMYKGDSDSTNANARQTLGSTGYAKNIMDLSKWIYSTDVHPWDADDDQGTIDNSLVRHHKLSRLTSINDVRVDPTDFENGTVTLLSDYYTEENGIVTPVLADRFAIVGGQLKVYQTNEKLVEMPWTDLREDEINRTLDVPAFYRTRDTAFDVTWIKHTEEVNGHEVVTYTAQPNKTYYASPTQVIPNEWYRRVPVYAYAKIWDPDINNGDGGYIIDNTKDPEEVGETTQVIDASGSTQREYQIAEVYEKYTRDTKEYRLSKYHAEFNDHLNFDYCAFYFILTEFFILYDSREKNMMIATWGPEKTGGNYIWYPIFYDMDTQLGINNSGTVYWDYDVNAQDDGIFSGAGSVLWDNFYACFIDKIKDVYRAMRDNNFRLEDCIRYYNTDSANRWSPIIKNVDAFYKYVAPAMSYLGYTTKQGITKTTSSFFYCAQGDRTLNRAAFFRNRFNYKDSEWLGGSYRTQGGANIEMRYDANWEGTSDPDASNWTTAEQKALRADLESNATFDIKPYLTQYCSVYYDEIPREGGRFDIQREPEVDDQGNPTSLTAEKYKKNLANIEKSGYITIHPLDAIQETIDSGLALSQQLVYIYGPEYLRDIGDLSLKYLDRFFCSEAIRLNSLIIGNDNPYYMNTGLVDDAFKLDTAYLNTDGTLNTNAKSLLTYLDMSNLAGLRQDIDVSGCLKIKTIKALGTKIPVVTVPVGNVIESLYLPATTTAFVHIKSQRLSELIRNKNRAISYYTKPNPPDVGLYIENITDRLNISRDEDIIPKYIASASESTKASQIASNITETRGNSDYHTEIAPYYIAMKKFHIEDGVLGFKSYELLDYIVKQKIKMRYDSELATGENSTKYDKQLALRLLGVQWTPFEKLDANAPDDRDYTDNATRYYIRNDDLTYSQLPYEGSSRISFEYANKNLGGVYYKNDSRLKLHGKVDDDVIDGIPNLNIFKMLLSDLDNPDRRTDNALNLYMFIDTALGGKNLPHIGGEVYLANTTPVSEYELYNIAQRFSAVLGKDDTPLTICAANVTPCPRAKFIEIQPNGDQEIIDTLRSQNASDAVTIPMNRYRRNYDFRGWASYEAIQQYDSNFLKVNGSGVVISTTGGVVENNSQLLDHLTITINQTTGEKIINGGSDETLTFGNQQVTYYAVFTLHKYEVKYVLDQAAYEASGGIDPTTYELVLVPSNSYIDNYPPTRIPYKDTSLPVGQMWKFDGWGAPTDNKPRANLHIAITKDMVFYPFYSVVNAYTNPIEAKYLDYVAIDGGIAIYGLKRQVGGRICLPKTINDQPVIAIYGTSWDFNNDRYTTSVISGTTTTKPAGNGLQNNTELTQVYFQGANDNTCNLTSIEGFAFYRAYNLEYIDLPDSLTKVGTYAFANCSKLAFTNLNKVTSVSRNAFMYNNTYGWTGEDYEYTYHVSTLYLTKDVTPLNGAFAGCGYHTIIIGNEGAPSEKQNYSKPFGGDAGCYTPTMTGGQPISNGGLKLLRIYHNSWGPSSPQVQQERLMFDDQYSVADIEVITVN